MSNVHVLRFDAAVPQICVPLCGETIADLGRKTQQLVNKPFDMIQFHSGSFNGVINFSQLWNALLTITKESDEAPLIFSCDMSQVPEYYHTETDYHNILLFAVRTGLVDAVEIESTLREDYMDDIAERAVDSGIVPIITLRLAGGSTAAMVTQKLTAIADSDASMFHLLCPVRSAADIEALKTGAAVFADSRKKVQIIIEPTGPAAKKELLAGSTFGSPVLYAAGGEETETRLSSTVLQTLLQKES